MSCPNCGFDKELIYWDMPIEQEKYLLEYCPDCGTWLGENSKIENIPGTLDFYGVKTVREALEQADDWIRKNYKPFK